MVHMVLSAKRLATAGAYTVCITIGIGIGIGRAFALKNGVAELPST